MDDRLPPTPHNALGSGQATVPVTPMRKTEFHGPVHHYI